MRKHVKKTLKSAWALWGNLSLGTILLILGLSAAGSIYGLRSNNLTMIDLRNEVILADKDDGDIEQALRDLRAHVNSHMNTDLSRDLGGVSGVEQPIQLIYSFYRASIDEYQKLVVDSAENTTILNDAIAACTSVQITERLNCINTEVETVDDSNFPALAPLPKDLFVHDFHSPRWTPDLAGISIVFFALSILLLATRFVVGYMVGRATRS